MSAAEEIVRRIQLVCNGRDDRYALHEPSLGPLEKEYVVDCIDSGWVSSVGSYVDRFEAELANLTGVKRAVAVVNGTAALHAALRLMGCGPGDEVLIPALTFVATANSVSYCGSIPHFVDCETESFGIDPKKLRAHLESTCSSRPGKPPVNKQTGREIKALVVVHIFGIPADLEPLMAVCEEFNLPLVEDAAESLGSLYQKKHTGSFGKIAALSFNGNKIITTGGGGAILTNDEELGHRAKHLTTTARVPHAWLYDHDEIGYNYRLPNLNAALGCAQLKRFPEMLEMKRSLHQYYRRVFADCDLGYILPEPPYAESNCWLNSFVLREGSLAVRDEILGLAAQRSIFLRPIWTPVSDLVMYRAAPRADLSVTRTLLEKVISLPSSAGLIAAMR